jgi:hypothetical protein
MTALLEYRIKRDPGTVTIVVHSGPSVDGIAEFSLHRYSEPLVKGTRGLWTETRRWSDFYAALAAFPRVQIIWIIPAEAERAAAAQETAA